MPIDAKKIVKNTFFLYGRMLLIMGVSFYTARIVLEVLGVNDYGLYFTIFSIIGLLSFLNGTLSGSTSRFITFELGSNNAGKLAKTFSTCWIAHILLGLIIIAIGETIGLWYVYKIMVVPPGQLNAAVIVYQFSILITFISILQVPFSAEIIAHEKMNVFAYLGIFEALAKLGIVFILKYGDTNKIILYAILQSAVSVSLFFFYLIYSYSKFVEVRFKLQFDKLIFKSILKFSGWNIIANLSNSLMNQGVVVLLNLFFQPAIVAAQTIANQLSTAASQFVNNIRQAVNPQIIKLYANSETEQSQSLTIKSSEYILYLLLLIGVPCIIVMPKLLSIWLAEVPEMGVAFCRLMIIQVILDNFNAAFYVPMIAANKISLNSILSCTLCIVQFFMTWLLFHFGLGPLWARYLGLITIVILSFIIKPMLLIHDVGFSREKILACVSRSFMILIIITSASFLLYISWPQLNIMDSIGIFITSFILVLLLSYLLIGKDDRIKLHQFISAKLSKLY